MSSGHTSTSHRQQCFREKADIYIQRQKIIKKSSKSPLKDYANVTQCNYWLSTNLHEQEVYIQSVFAEPESFWLMWGCKAAFNSCPVRMEVSVSERPHSAATVWVENTTNLTVMPLRINTASSPAGPRGPIGSRLAWEVLNKVGQQIKKGTDWTDPRAGEQEEEGREETALVRLCTE